MFNSFLTKPLLRPCQPSPSSETDQHILLWLNLDALLAAFVRASRVRNRLRDSVVLLLDSFGSGILNRRHGGGFAMCCRSSRNAKAYQDIWMTTENIYLQIQYVYSWKICLVRFTGCQPSGAESKRRSTRSWSVGQCICYRSPSGINTAIASIAISILTSSEPCVVVEAAAASESSRPRSCAWARTAAPAACTIDKLADPRCTLDP